MSANTLTPVAGPNIKTALPGPNATRILEADERYISPSYTRSYPAGRQARPRRASWKTSTATSFSTSPPASP